MDKIVEALVNKIQHRILQNDHAVYTEPDTNHEKQEIDT